MRVEEGNMREFKNREKIQENEMERQRFKGE